MKTATPQTDTKVDWNGYEAAILYGMVTHRWTEPNGSQCVRTRDGRQYCVHPCVFHHYNEEGEVIRAPGTDGVYPLRWELSASDPYHKDINDETL